jgi:hypothetical protein
MPHPLGLTRRPPARPAVAEFGQITVKLLLETPEGVRIDGQMPRGGGFFEYHPRFDFVPGHARPPLTAAVSLPSGDALLTVVFRRWLHFTRLTLVPSFGPRENQKSSPRPLGLLENACQSTRLLFVRQLSSLRARQLAVVLRGEAA